MPRSARGPRNL